MIGSLAEVFIAGLFEFKLDLVLQTFCFTLLCEYMREFDRESAMMSSTRMLAPG